MIGDYFKEVTKYHGFSDFSLCAEPLTAKTASWHNEAARNWDIQNEDGRASFKSVSKAFGYELLARVGNVVLLPAALLDAIFHVAVGAFTLLAAIPEKIYLMKKSRSEQNLEVEAENVEGKVASRKFTFAGACSNFESAIKYVGVAIFGTITGVFFDPQAAADRAKAGRNQIIANLVEELNALKSKKDNLEEESAEFGNENPGFDLDRNNPLQRSTVEDAKKIADLEKALEDETNRFAILNKNSIDRLVNKNDEIENLKLQVQNLKNEMKKTKAKLSTDGTEVKEEKEVNFTEQSQTQNNASPRSYVNVNSSPRYSELHIEDASLQTVDTNEKKKEDEVIFTVHDSQYIILENIEERDDSNIGKLISDLNEQEIVSPETSEEKK